MAQKEAQGVAEKRQGRRGPGSVIGSSVAGCVCALLSIYGIVGNKYAQLWKLGFVTCFCTKLSDTVSSEIGKAYGKTTYLVTTFKIVPRGTEGAVSIEGTLAGVVSSILLASVGCLMGQIANLGESIIGAALQDKEGFQWLNNDAVNVINISIGSSCDRKSTGRLDWSSPFRVSDAASRLTANPRRRNRLELVDDLDCSFLKSEQYCYRLRGLNT